MPIRSAFHFTIKVDQKEKKKENLLYHHIRSHNKKKESVQTKTNNKLAKKHLDLKRRISNYNANLEMRRESA